MDRVAYYFMFSDCDPLVECFLNGLRKCVDPNNDPDQDCILTQEVMASASWVTIRSKRSHGGKAHNVGILSELPGQLSRYELISTTCQMLTSRQLYSGTVFLEQTMGS